MNSGTDRRFCGEIDSDEEQEIVAVMAERLLEEERRIMDRAPGELTTTRRLGEIGFTHALNEITGDVAKIGPGGLRRIMIAGMSPAGRLSLLFDAGSVEKSWAPISADEVLKRLAKANIH